MSPAERLWSLQFVNQAPHWKAVLRIEKGNIQIIQRGETLELAIPKAVTDGKPRFKYGLRLPANCDSWNELGNEMAFDLSDLRTRYVLLLHPLAYTTRDI